MYRTNFTLQLILHMYAILWVSYSKSLTHKSELKWRLMLVVRENYIFVVITHSAAFHNVSIGETLYSYIVK